jgi:hypothetical protein
VRCFLWTGNGAGKGAESVGKVAGGRWLGGLGRGEKGAEGSGRGRGGEGRALVKAPSAWQHKGQRRR